MKCVAVCQASGRRWAARWATCEGRSRDRCAKPAAIGRSLSEVWRPLGHSTAFTLRPGASPESLPPPWLPFHLPLRRILACLCNSLFSATPATRVPALGSSCSPSETQRPHPLKCVACPLPGRVVACPYSARPPPLQRQNLCCGCLSLAAAVAAYVLRHDAGAGLACRPQ